MTRSSILFFLLGITVASIAQTKPVQVEETKVPKAVVEGFNNSIGFPATWYKSTLSNGQVRYVAVTEQMDNTTGKMNKFRYRYTEAGRLTSFTQYRGSAKEQTEDELLMAFGTGDADPGVHQRFKAINKANNITSFEAFSFSPGNSPETIKVYRLSITDKSGKRKVLFIDGDAKEFDMSKYPVRLMEAGEGE